MTIEEKIHEMIRFSKIQTGKEPDAIYLEDNDWRNFIDGVSLAFIYGPLGRMGPPSRSQIEDAYKFMGIPVRKFQVERFTKTPPIN